MTRPTSRPRTPEQLLRDLGSRLAHYSGNLREALEVLRPGECPHCRAAHDVLSREYQPPADHLLTRQEAAKALAVTPHKLDAIRREGLLHSYPNPDDGGRRGYRPEDLDALTL